MLQFNDHTVLVDTGFPADIAAVRGIENFRDPNECLSRLNISASEISVVIVSHLHFDHFSTPERFPNAEFIVQRDDVDYFTGRGKSHPITSIADVKSLDSLAILRRNGRLRELSGDAMVDEGIRVQQVPGHTPGSQIVVVEFAGSVIVLACDASHFYENLETSTPSAIMYDYDGYQRGFARISASAGTGRWFPGHDPAMLERLREVGDGVYQMPR
ncbi:MBL fold metallo-hydrolase [Cryobacterium sp. Y62]|uniref:MBL fold metallo-hydrolase n=1 Tax=Cryobacterium sp. Y62 TaxID=2048284 RepID=UPI001E2FF22A|nr:MBL fold metallo-hydrolase [Cryobacterium sp. Y62]